MRHMIMGIKIVKEKKTDFTFIDDGLTLRLPKNVESDSKKDKPEQDFRLRDSGRVAKLKKSRMEGGHGMQGHSPVYE